ncbi:MAG: hypothetical protein LBG58_00400 [Planctomycetaceae bacterium]|nr:hypothetical protein [Planctomycetaceae bacterium]
MVVLFEIFPKVGYQEVGNLSPKGCNGWVCYSSCTRLFFNFHLQTGASRLSPTQCFGETLPAIE